MGKANLLTLLKVSIILIWISWVCVWLLKPTEFWTKSWKAAEERMRTTVMGYSGLDFAVYSFPVIAGAICAFIYLHFYGKEPRSRPKRTSITALSNPLIVRSPLGIISGSEILVVSLFVLFLAWTFYAHISNDFKKMIPIKSLQLNRWQLKFIKVGTRFGLLAEACLALLLLPILRGMSLFRLLGIQFEASVRYHIWLGTAMIMFATLHGSSILFIWGINHRLQDEMRRWQKTGRVYLAGEIALATALVIWITSLPQIRRKQFEIFYYAHHLYIVFLVFFLFHTGDRHFYMVFPGVFLFALDRLLRIIQSRHATCLSSARIFPCKAIELNLPKLPSVKYSPTSLIFINIPSISKFQWHPFSITSSSSVNHDTISVITKCEGWWTTSLYNAIHAVLDSDPGQVNCLPVAVEGPYGPISTEFLRYDSLIMIAGGIGITPFLSILMEKFSADTQNRDGLPKKVQLIYAVKKTQDITLLNPIEPLLLNQSVELENFKLKIFVTQEEQPGIAVRELLNEMSQVLTVNFDTKCSNHAIFGPESLIWMASIIGCSSTIFLAALSCLNHVFLRPEEQASTEKNPSWIVDLLLVCSLIVTIASSTLATAIMRWRKPKKSIPPASLKASKSTELSSIEATSALERHEIHFQERPNFEDILSQFPVETSRGSDIGILVSGPESMKESVASSCQKISKGLKMGAERKKPSFKFHSLNFAL